MTIRQAAQGDAPVLARMRWNFRGEGRAIDDSYPEFEARFLQFFADALASGRWMILLIEQDGEILAHIYVQIIEKVPRPGALDQCFGYVTNVYTLPEYRNQKLGTQLMEQVVAWAKAQQLEFLILWPSDRSVSYYQRSGFDPAPALELVLDDE